MRIHHGAVLGLMIGLAGNADAIIVTNTIDDFDTIAGSTGPNPLVVNSVGPVATLSTPDAGPILFDREISLQATALQVAGFDEVRANVTIAMSRLDFASSTNADGLLMLDYEEPSPTTLPLAGNEGVAVDFLFFDVPAGQAMDVTVTLTSPTGTAAQTLPVVGTGPGIIEFPFVGFTPAGGFNLADAEQITFVIDSPTAADYSISRIVTYVPEPGTIGLALLGGAALLGRRRNLRSIR